MKRALLAAPLLLLALLVACADDSDDADGAGGIPQAVVDVIDDHIRATGLDGNTDGRQLFVDCAEIGPQPALCIDVEASTVLDSEATVRVYANQSDASWDLSLLKRDGRWLVTNVAYTGVR